MSEKSMSDAIEAMAKNLRSLWAENLMLRQSIKNMRLDFYNEASPGDTFIDPKSFAFYRIIGNDLPPRHHSSQSLSNIRFIVENEPRRSKVERIWILNRIYSSEIENSIVEYLTAHGESFHRIPFELSAYREIDWDFSPLVFGAESMFSQTMAKVDVKSVSAVQNRELLLDAAYNKKILYVANNNGARNLCMDLGRSRARWVMPWDGNCFLTEDGWSKINEAVDANPNVPYIIVPMARLSSNQVLHDPEFRPVADEEPQVIFRNDAREKFNPEFRYGRRPKVELLKRLRVAGPWDKWPIAAWEPKWSASADAELYQEAGWVARLSSGAQLLETSGASTERGVARSQGIRGLIDRIDRVVIERARVGAVTRVLDWTTLVGQKRRYQARDPVIIDLIDLQLLPAAEAALLRGPYSVLDKRLCGPSNDPNDYWHPAPYYWPNEETASGFPFVQRDGLRVPGTQLGDPEAVNYDRSSLQSLFDDTFTLSLAAFFSGECKYADHAAILIRHWFVDEQTRMNPHLAYAQIIPGDRASRGRGIIEAKDFYFFLDAVSLLDSIGAAPADIMSLFRFWLKVYLDWLWDSPQGQSERAMRNNHGTAYDLQVASISSFLRSFPRLQSTFLNSCQRLYFQFDENGSQPLEMSRTNSQHYCHFNLQTCINLADLYRSCGLDLWGCEAPGGRSINAALRYLERQQLEGTWIGEQIESFDCRRSTVLFHAYRMNGGLTEADPAMLHRCPENYDPYSGIRPWWRLGTKGAV
jgi:hypothetical protein